MILQSEVKFKKQIDYDFERNVTKSFIAVSFKEKHFEEWTIQDQFFRSWVNNSYVDSDSDD